MLDTECHFLLWVNCYDSYWRITILVELQLFSESLPGQNIVQYCGLWTNTFIFMLISMLCNIVNIVRQA